MATRQLLHDGGGIWIWLDTSGNQNEIQIDQKQDASGDATAVRLGVYGLNTKISFDKLTGNDTDPDNAPRRSERMMLEFAIDDHPQAAPDAAILKVYAQTQPIGQETDAGEVLLASLCARELETRVLLRASGGLIGGSSARVTRFYTDDNAFCYNVQRDGAPFGRMVVYATNGSADESTWTAVATLTGLPL